MVGLKRDLPTATNNMNDVRRARKQLNNAIEEASRAYIALFELFPGYALPADVKEAARPQWLNDYVDGKVKSVDNLAGTDVENVLPIGQLADIRQQWEAKRVKGLEHVHTIAGLIKWYPRGKYTIRQGQIRCENLDEQVKAMTAVPVGDVCKELFRLYANVVDDLARLNNYAKEHDCKRFPATTIGRWATAADFAEAFNCGAFSEHPTNEQLNRRVYEEDDTPRLTDHQGRKIRRKE